jgi:hypothetical protein
MEPPTQDPEKIAEAMDIAKYLGEPVPSREGQSELVKWQLMNEQILDELEHGLRGDKFDVETKQWVTNEDRRLLTDQGISILVSHVGSHVNKVTALSDLDEEMIRAITRDAANDITDLIFKNHYKWEINMRSGSPTLIVDKLRWLIYAGLRRSWQALFLEHLSKTRKEIARIGDVPMKRTRNFDGLFGSGGN